MPLLSQKENITLVTEGNEAPWIEPVAMEEAVGYHLVMMHSLHVPTTVETRSYKSLNEPGT
jgi:hypothetical protein